MSASNSLRGVRVSGIGVACPAGIGPASLATAEGLTVPGFKARAWMDRKQLKLMTRAVRLGVAAARMAVEDDEGVEVAPLRRGFFVGASPQPGDPNELRQAISAGEVDGRFDLQRFAAEGYPQIHPLWLLRGLSNNVLGFASAVHDTQGVNANYCDGEEGGWTALTEGAAAIREGRADLVVAGGAECLVGAEGLFAGRPCAEGAAFVILRPSDDPADGLPDREALRSELEDLGLLGAATWPVALARHLLREGVEGVG